MSMNIVVAVVTNRSLTYRQYIRPLAQLLDERCVRKKLKSPLEKRLQRTPSDMSHPGNIVESEKETNEDWW
jgi:hypothetical protein